MSWNERFQSTASKAADWRQRTLLASRTPVHKAVTIHSRPFNHCCPFVSRPFNHHNCCAFVSSPCSRHSFCAFVARPWPCHYFCGFVFRPCPHRGCCTFVPGSRPVFGISSSKFYWMEKVCR
ncbi:uncharacterized protein BYT42DRAFT_343616 [Radiomyces spectabilis]|uniref:uncharacterized protein n=1 Tax=Radiomyces spectabilis TaxID=64574 RepID=UPI00221F35A2|nr:uncharacterized protein BYT42DRAFT_343616 [Radiomyces spectabilis]KAI8377411.1 hypothetical protein BYT42DRAFT_343616 [Radiomyces spectabilis]